MTRKRRRQIITIALLAAALALGLYLSLTQGEGIGALTAADVADWDGSGIELRFFDVGQADCTLIRCGNDAMLVDGAYRDDGPGLTSALQALGVSRLTWAVCTHAHSDHAGGLSYIISRIPAARALVPYRESDNVWFNDFVAVAGERGQVTVARPGDEFALGEARVQVLGPLHEYEDLNDSSLILRVVYGETAFLLTGDATWVAERDLVDSGCELKSDLLKAGHHGANSSSSYVFLMQVAPDVAVISVGAVNDYNHPGSYTLDRFYDEGARVLRTDLQGTIICRSDGRKLSFGFDKPEAEQ